MLAWFTRIPWSKEEGWILFTVPIGKAFRVAPTLGDLFGKIGLPRFGRNCRHVRVGRAERDPSPAPLR